MVLTVGNFHFPPFTFISIDHSTGEKSYTGIDVAILRLVAAALGQELRFQNPSDGGNWGTVYSNGTATGLMADVITDVVDVGSAEFFNMHRRNPYADPSSFYFFDYFCFVLAKPPEAPKWMHLLMPFTTGSWIAVITSWVVTAGFYCLLTAMMGSQDYGKMFLESLSFFINQPVKLGTKWVKTATLLEFMLSYILFFFCRLRSARVSKGVLAVAGGILAVMYGDKLISFLTVHTYSSLPHKMADILDMPDMKVGTTSLDEQTDFINSPNPKIRRLADRYLLVDSWEEAMEKVSEGSYAFLNGKMSSEYNIRSQFTDR